jgi:hypothetical protein
MANKDLFKQAIAEAKSVREAAIANAKEALEETLTPHLKDMLAAKLQEMEEKDIEEEVVDEAQGNIDAHEENPADQLEEELTFEEEEEAEEADDDSEESEEEAEEVEVKDMEVEDLKDLIRDIIAQEMGAGEAEEELPADELPVDDMVGAEDEEEIDLDELLREIYEMSHEDKEEKMEEEIDEVVDPVTVAAGDATQHRNVTEVDLEEARPGYAVDDFGPIEDNPIGKAFLTLVKSAKKAGKSVADFVKDIELGKMSDAMREVELEETNDLEEAMATIEELKGQLQEVNLLNAKLLYVNKVFKANNLTESQKVNVIAAFDKAETVKEVKLVFETVSDNVVGKTAKGSIKEAKLGMASKATGTTASKPEVISEVSDAVRRMQKLAGIIK